MITKKSVTRERSKQKIRKKIFGTAEKPRLTVYRSLSHIYTQLIDDEAGKTLLAVSTKSAELAEQLKAAPGKVGKSKLVGMLLAKKAIEQNIKTAVFDRNGYQYHGRIKAVAEGVREGGIVM
ncbi:MAG: 50S ribosomal protein L18 [Ignavibacteria bacterium]|nr:50S ribosomal protein L18 [Ignavibacteria bacterium]